MIGVPRPRPWRRRAPHLLASLAAIAAVLVPAAASRAEAPGDVRYQHPAGSPVDPAVFPHWVHRLRFTCNACHPALFPMDRTQPTTMDDIREGRSCGACHNGRVAFGVSTKMCNRCHAPPAP